MGMLRMGIWLAIPAALVVQLFSVGISAGNCRSNQRRPWTWLSPDEKKAYIDAELCLIRSPPKNHLPGAHNRYEELQWAHLHQMRFVHFTAAFLYWHRYFVKAHERLLQTECGYRGAQPFWDEMADVLSITQSEIWNPNTGFGGNGEDGDGCVTDGPFGGMVLHLHSDHSDRPYCLNRNFDQGQFDSAHPRRVNRCYDMDNFRDAWPCYEGDPHNAGHNGIGGVMADVAIGPGDPIFWLHHAYLDKLFDDWQQGGEGRQRAVSGPNIQPGSNDSQLLPEAAFTNYNGDNGPETTAKHVLWMAGILPNVTISDVMDLSDDVICAEYIGST